MCTHYLQVVSVSTTDVGCGYYHCPNGNAAVVCNYSPKGHWASGFRPYLAGPPCSQCPSTEGWCDQGMCVDCPVQNCDCPLQCKNCGVLDTTNCTCSCKDGWDSPDCSDPCANKHHYCGANPGWPIAAYCTADGFAVVNDYCREMCGYCDFATHGDPNACCEGQICYNGGYLDTTTCLCVCPQGFWGEDCTSTGNPCLFVGIHVEQNSDFSCVCPEGISGKQCDTVSFPGGCYQFSSDTVSYSDAEQACSTKNGHLADVKAEHQQNIIANGIAATTNASNWLGLKLQAVYTLTYSDGLAAPDVLQFTSQRPSHCDLCVFMDSPHSSNNSLINTASCMEEHNYVCESDSKPCEPNVCQNGGNCTSCFDASICECSDGFEGKLCEINVDECASSPCQHGGTCHDRTNSYICHCQPGYAGDSCQTDLDWCSLVTCPFHWTCQDDGTHFTCLAPPPILRVLGPQGCSSASCPDDMHCREVDDGGSFSCWAD
ncbi:FAT1 [Branchiostoma lanceolatum]|uniref:FAT1 protein n=1 Tax=Branchiostoma lanceolatum TaxID=7740 RepID=A0A8K0AJ28_BRALA|nr:FAT1 [Branchiostoma lanceolatum]